MAVVPAKRRQRNLMSLTDDVTLVAMLYGIIVIGSRLWTLGEPMNLEARYGSTGANIELAFMALIVVTPIAFCLWVYRAGRSLSDAGHTDLAFSPRARLWWFFVPVANLIVPYFGMRELWNVSHGEPDRRATAPLVLLWWILWLASTLGVCAVGIMKLPKPHFIMGISIIHLALLAVAVPMLRQIARAQSTLPPPKGLEEIFA